jgi:hypothetical protein
MAGIMAAGATPSGFDGRFGLSHEVPEKPSESGGFFAIRGALTDPGKLCRFAGHRGVALLNDALLRRFFRTGSGRIAQLVEQMTLNHRVPGSSPGAPTKNPSRTVVFGVFASAYPIERNLR